MDLSSESALTQQKGQQAPEKKNRDTHPPAGPHATTGHLATTSRHGAAGVNETTCQPQRTSKIITGLWLQQLEQNINI